MNNGWQFPSAHRAKGHQLWRVFDAFRTRSSENAGHLKASASELLGAICLLRHFVDTHVQIQAEVAAELDSLKAAFDVVDLFLLAKRRRISMQDAGVRLYRAVATSSSSKTHCKSHQKHTMF